MKVTIVNRVTGEVISTVSDTEEGWTTTQCMQSIRGVIRQWMKTGLDIHQFDVIKWSDIRLHYYFRQYAWDRMITKCDVCGTVTTNSELDWIDDSEGVSMFNQCKGGCPPPTVTTAFENNWMWEIGEDMKKMIFTLVF